MKTILKNKWKNTYSNLFLSNPYAENIRYLRRGLSLCFLGEIALMYSLLGAFSFNESLTKSADQGLPIFYRIFYFPENNSDLNMLILATVGIIIANMLVKNRLVGLLTWIASVSFHYRFRNVTDAGSCILDIFFLLLIFTTEENFQSNQSLSKEENLQIAEISWIQQTQILISNLVFYAMRFQLCFIYAMAGVGKAIAPLWLKGDALYSILKTPEYTLPVVSSHISKGFILKSANYFTIFFQLSWPLGVWNKKLRKYYIFLGTLMHLSIAYVMGITSFGFVMIASYLLFSDAERLNKISNFFEQIKQWLSQRLNGILTKSWNKLRAILLVACSGWLVFHCFAIIELVLPKPFGGSPTLARSYTLPYFPQVWLLFGPQVHNYYNLMEIRCEEVGESNWIDPLSSVIEQHQQNRFSKYAYLGRALVGWSMDLSNISSQFEADCKILSDHHCLQKIKDQSDANINYQKIRLGALELCRAQGFENPKFVQIRHVRKYVDQDKIEVRTFNPYRWKEKQIEKFN